MQNSPFEMFRRNQRRMMVVVTGLAMFSFIFLDSANQQQQTPLALGVMIVALGCAGGLWVLGAPRGKGGEWALWGALIGGVVAFVGLRSSGPVPRVRSTLGAFTAQDLGQIGSRRAIANRFAAVVMSKAGSRSVQPALFGRLTDAELVHRQALLAEAKSMGLRLSDDAVTRLIDQLAQSRLSQADLLKTLREVGVGEGELYDILREERTIQEVAKLIAPPRSASGSTGLRTPEELWQDFRKLNLKQKLEYVAVPVADFVAEVKDPEDGALRSFFMTYRNRLSPGANEPGFLEPPKVRLAYLSANYEDFEKQAAEPTDDEVTAHYEKHKAQRYREKPEPKAPAAKDDGDSPPVSAPAQPGAANDGPAAATPDQPKAGAPKEGPAAESTPSAEKPAEKPAEKSDAPTPSDASTTEPAPGGTIGDEDLVRESLQLAQAETPPPAETPKSADTPPTAEKPVAETPAAEKPAVEKPAAEKPATEKPATEKPASETPTTGEEKPATPAASGSSVPKPATPPESFRPLDDELKSEIRDELLKDRTFQKMSSLADEAFETMAKLADQYLGARDANHAKKLAEDYAVVLQDFAEERGLKYVETDSLSMQELQLARGESIGLALPPALGGASFGGAPVWQEAFSSPLLYSARRVDDSARSQAYAYWKIAETGARAPEFDEPGMKDRALAAWKFEQAAPLAQKRAEELALLARNSDKPFREALIEQTVTGGEGADLKTLEPNETAAFSWLSLPSTAPELQFFRDPAMTQPRLSLVPGIAPIDNEFFKTVFEELGPKDVGVARAADKSAYFVVQVKDRDASGSGATDDLAAKALQQQFLRERFQGMPQFGFYTPYDHLSGGELRNSMQQWSVAFDKKYGIVVEENESSGGPEDGFER